MTHNWWWVMNDESPDDPCIWSRGNLYPFFWCKWYLVSSFQICVGGTRWRHHNDVITTTKSVSFITWFLWCLFRVTFWIKQAFTKQWSEHHFSVPYHVTQCHMMETWWWRHRRCFRHVIMGSHDIPIYSILKCSNRTKFTCNFSLYMWGVASKIATIFTIFEKCCSLIWNPLYFCASEFRSKAIWPTADNRLKTPERP